MKRRLKDDDEADEPKEGNNDVFQCVLSEEANFTTFIDFVRVKEMSKEFRLVCTKEGLSVQMVDPCMICIIDYKANAKKMTNYRCDKEPVFFDMSLDLLQKVFKYAKNCAVTLSCGIHWNGENGLSITDKLNVLIEGPNRNGSSELTTLALEFATMPQPTFDNWAAEVLVYTKAFNDLCKQLMEMSDQVVFKLETSGQMKAIVKGDGGSSTEVVSTIKSTVKQSLQQGFSLKHIYVFSDGKKFSDQMYLRFHHNELNEECKSQPLHMFYHLPEEAGWVCVRLAPKNIEDEV